MLGSNIGVRYCKDKMARTGQRHLDTMQFQTFLHCKVPRADCPAHGVGTVKTPWAGKNSRFTIFFERLAIDMLLAARNITKACELLGIDEKAFKKRNKYMSILTDLDGSRVLHGSKFCSVVSLKVKNGNFSNSDSPKH